MTFNLDDLVLACAKALPGDHKITDQWEDIPHCIPSQLAEQPVF